MKKSGQNTHTQKTERERKKFIAHKTLLFTADLMHTFPLFYCNEAQEQRTS